MITNTMKLYQRSSDFLWTDEYIAKHMLLCHLNPSIDAASRNNKDIEQTVEWISAQIPPKSSILDLGCGPGLYSEKLAARAYSVTGIDISENSIAYAKQKTIENKSNIVYKTGSYLEPIQGSFDAAICIYCDYAALTFTERKLFLKNVWNVLKEDGILIFDVFDENKYKGQTTGKSWYVSDKADFFSEHPHIVLNDEQYFEEEKVWGSRNLVIDMQTSKVKDFIVWDTLYNEKRIFDELKNGGFSLELVCNNVFDKASSNNQNVLFVKAKKNLAPHALDI